MLIEPQIRSYRNILTLNNLLEYGVWKEQGILSVELLFIWKGLSVVFPEGTNLLVPLSDTEQNLTEVLLQFP